MSLTFESRDEFGKSRNSALRKNIVREETLTNYLFIKQYHIPMKRCVLEKCGLLIKEVVEKTRKKLEI